MTNESTVPSSKIELRRAESRRAAHLDYLNVLLFCWSAFIVGFIHSYAERGAVWSQPIVMKEAPQSTISPELGSDFVALRDTLATQYKENGLLRGFKVTSVDDTLEIHFGVADLFPSGQAELSDREMSDLASLGSEFVKHLKGEYLIDVEGHTDDVPVVQNAWKFPTNWELSSARAAAIGRVFLTAGVPPEKLRVSGRAGSTPLVPNRDPAGEPVVSQQMQNRRVVIHISPK